MNFGSHSSSRAIFTSCHCETHFFVFQALEVFYLFSKNLSTGAITSWPII
jgi:hypothetical protein